VGTGEKAKSARQGFGGTFRDLKNAEREVYGRNELAGYGTIARAIGTVAPSEGRDRRLEAETAIAEFVAAAIANAAMQLPQPMTLDALVEEIRRTHFPNAAPVTLPEEKVLKHW
jgi:hypothetical protein